MNNEIDLTKCVLVWDDEFFNKNGMFELIDGETGTKVAYIKLGGIVKF